jgi:hypothetical protein
MFKKKRSFIFIILVIVLTLGMLAAGAKPSFSDVESDDWYYETVTKLVERGGINGFPDGRFKPINKMKKGEFVKLIVGSLGFEEDPLESLHWSSGYIEKAKELNILDDSEFEDSTLNENINRNEMAKIAVRTLEHLGEDDYPDNLDEYKSLIADYNSIDSEYKEYVLKAYVKGIITGYEDSSFKGEKELIRAEASTVAIRLFDDSLRKPAELEEETEISPEAGYNLFGAEILEVDGKNMKIIDGLGRELTCREANVEVVEELTRTEPMTLRWDDPYRPMAIEGDIFITEDGREVVLKIDEETGVLGFGQNVATEMGRYYPGATRNVAIVHGKQGYRSYDKTSGSPYYYDADTGAGYYQIEWNRIIAKLSNSYMKEKFPDAKKGAIYRDVVLFDGHNWLNIGGSSSSDTPSAWENLPYDTYYID